MSREHPMSKETITRLFAGALAAATAGLVLVLAAVWTAVAGDVVPTAALAVAAAAALIAAAVAAATSWIGALFNTARLEDRTWFVSLLVLGLLGGGVLAMVAYVFAGPDGTGRGAARARLAPALIQQEAEVQ
jgi:hypothetical protein